MADRSLTTKSVRAPRNVKTLVIFGLVEVPPFRGATITDVEVGLTPVIDASAVNTNVLGTYQVTYNVTDSSGNMATEVIRDVEVVIGEADITTSTVTAVPVSVPADGVQTSLITVQLKDALGNDLTFSFNRYAIDFSQLCHSTHQRN